MIDTILQTFGKTKKDVTIIDILMHHIINDILKEKWKFTIDTYNHLVENLEIYQNKNKLPIVKNFIINDNETLLQMIYEFKEDIYPLFESNIFLLLDSFTHDELIQFQEFEKNILNKYQNFNSYQNYLLTNDLSKIKIFLNDLIVTLNHNLNTNELKFIPFDSLHELIELKTYTTKDYFNLYQIVNKSLKYLKDKSAFKEAYLQMRFNVFILLAGEKHV